MFLIVNEQNFIKVNNPDMKNVQGLTIEESKNKLEHKMESQKSVAKLQTNNFRQREMTTGFSKQRGLSAQNREKFRK